MVIFLLEFQEIWPLMSTAQALHSECLTQKKQIPLGYDRLNVALIRNHCNSAVLLPWLLIYIKRGFVRHIYCPKCTVL